MMEIDKMKSNLKMSNLYFSKCSIERSAELKNGSYKADLQKNIERTNDHEYDVELKLTIEKEDLSLLVVANAHFLYEDEDYSREENIIKANTVAIMFPFLRSQVTLLTTQPAMTPILLPPINTKKFT